MPPALSRRVAVHQDPASTQASSLPGADLLHRVSQPGQIRHLPQNRASRWRPSRHRPRQRLDVKSRYPGSAPPFCLRTVPRPSLSRHKKKNQAARSGGFSVMSGRRRPAAGMKRNKLRQHLPRCLRRLNGTRRQAAHPGLSQTGMRKCHRPRKPRGPHLPQVRLNRQPRQAEQAIASSLPPCAAMARRKRHGNAFRRNMEIFLALASQISSGQILADWEPFTVSS